MEELEGDSDVDSVVSWGSAAPSSVVEWTPEANASKRSIFTEIIASEKSIVAAETADSERSIVGWSSPDNNCHTECAFVASPMQVPTSKTPKRKRTGTGVSEMRKKICFAEVSCEKGMLSINVNP